MKKLHRLEYENNMNLHEERKKKTLTLKEYRSRLEMCSSFTVLQAGRVCTSFISPLIRISCNPIPQEST
jgi:hypothetical protein